MNINNHIESISVTPYISDLRVLRLYEDIPSSDDLGAKEVTDLIDWQGFFPFDEA